MSVEMRRPAQPATEGREEPTPQGAVPMWLFILLFVALFWGMNYFDRHGAWFNGRVYAPYRSLAELQMHQPPTGGINLERGRAVYESVCALCHGVDGKGKPGQAPPLAGAEWVLGPVNRLVRIPLAGLTGPIEVNGQQWNLAMPAMGAALSDEDLAAVLSYMRTSWGNKGTEVTAEQVGAVRKEIGNRTQPFTAAELLTVQ
jgi:mono/diheme cytochrome c family protein